MKFWSGGKIKKKFLFLGVLFLLSLVSIIMNGYYYGDYAQGQLLVFQKSFLDQELHQKDPILLLKPQFYTYLFFILSFPSRMFGIENTYFFSYITVTFAFYVAVFLLARLLFKNDTVAYLSVILLLLNKPQVGEDSIFPVFFPRVFVFPILLFAVYFFLKDKYVPAFLLVGIGMNLHITSAVHLFLMMMFCFLFVWRTAGVSLTLKRIAGYSLLTFAISLPTFFWSLSSPTVDLFPPQSWWDIIELKFLHHLAVLWWGPFTWIRGGAFVLVFLLALRFRPQKELHQKVMGLMWGIVALAIIATFFYYVVPISVLVTLTLWRSVKFFTIFAIIYNANYLLETYKRGALEKLASAGMAVSLLLSNFKMVLLFILPLIAIRMRKKTVLFLSLIASFSVLFVASVIGSITLRIPYLYSLKMGFMPFLIITISLTLMLMYELTKGRVWKGSPKQVTAILLVSLVLLSTAVGILLIKKHHFANRMGAVYEHIMDSYAYDTSAVPLTSFSEIGQKPRAAGIVVRPITISSLNDFLTHPVTYLRYNVDFPGTASTDWKKAQVWARENTAKDDVFIVPPYISDFRALSERAILADWEDIAMVNYNVEVGKELLKRVQAACGAKLLGECVENACIDLCRKNYRGFTEDNFRRMASVYGADYVVVESPSTLNFNLVYSNSGFRIYRILG